MKELLLLLLLLLFRCGRSCTTTNSPFPSLYSVDINHVLEQVI
jgi:hypothetical protein